jgi:hypothetical protein
LLVINGQAGVLHKAEQSCQLLEGTEYFILVRPTIVEAAGDMTSSELITSVKLGELGSHCGAKHVERLDPPPEVRVE